MNDVSVTGIVISAMPIGEYDRRSEILTSEFGRISAFARGARKPGSSLVCVTRPFVFGRFELYQGKSSYTLKSAAPVEYFEKLTSDIELTYYGFYFLELAQYFSRENMDAADMVRLLYYSLKTLEKKKIPKNIVKSVYELKMLQINGLVPDIGRLTSGKGFYSFAADMSGGCGKACSYVLESSIEKLYTFVLSEEAAQEFERIASRLVEQNTDKKFKSVSFIEDLL